MKGKANLEATDKVRHWEDNRCAPYELTLTLTDYVHWPRVCSLKKGSTPLMHAAQRSKSPAVVEALVKAKANLEATNSVRHLGDSRCSLYVLTLTLTDYVLIDHACVR